MHGAARAAVRPRPDRGAAVKRALVFVLLAACSKGSPRPTESTETPPSSSAPSPFPTRSSPRALRARLPPTSTAAPGPRAAVERHAARPGTRAASRAPVRMEGGAEGADGHPAEDRGLGADGQWPTRTCPSRRSSRRRHRSAERLSRRRPALRVARHVGRDRRRRGGTGAAGARVGRPARSRRAPGRHGHGDVPRALSRRDAHGRLRGRRRPGRRDGLPGRADAARRVRAAPGRSRGQGSAVEKLSTLDAKNGHAAQTDTFTLIDLQGDKGVLDDNLAQTASPQTAVSASPVAPRARRLAPHVGPGQVPLRPWPPRRATSSSTERRRWRCRRRAAA